MKNLSNRELDLITGGSFFVSFELLYKIYRILKIKFLMNKLFID